MAEKIIHEVQVIETDAGYRIEIKGDKEQLRKMGFIPKMHFGPKMGFWQPHGHHGRPHHHRHHKPHRGEQRHHKCGPEFMEYDLGPWWDDEPTPKETPSKDA